jgi:hypothetical protein
MYYAYIATTVYEADTNFFLRFHGIARCLTRRRIWANSTRATALSSDRDRFRANTESLHVRAFYRQRIHLDAMHVDTPGSLAAFAEGALIAGAKVSF